MLRKINAECSNLPHPSPSPLEGGDIASNKNYLALFASTTAKAVMFTMRRTVALGVKM
jgi:hypothetical protein